MEQRAQADRAAAQQATAEQPAADGAAATTGGCGSEDRSRPRQEADDTGDRIHICVGADCNNNCIFCMEEDRDARRARVDAQTRDDVRRMIEANRGTREILFTSGEPTLNPDLPLYARWAAAAGYEIVGVISNGRRFAYEPYARALLRAGINNVIVSIHGPDARTHDALARTPQAFEQTLQGLKNLAALRAHRRAGTGPLRIQTSTVVTRRNLDKLEALCRLLEPLALDVHVFNVMMPDGRGAGHFDRLMPRYTEVARVFAALCEAAPELLPRLALVDIPYCVTEGLPARVRGFVERYFHYEPEGSFEERVRQLGLEMPEGDRARLFERQAMEGGQGRFSLVTRTFQEQFVRGKRPECASCRYDADCRGVWNVYAGRHGWDEFVPVK